MKMAEDKKKVVLRGCIKTTRGPWIVHKTKKDGSIVTKYRFPSDEERRKNKQREKKRRSVTRNIFRGLREHGNYNLPKHADSNDLLVALCEEAGWHVEEDGTIYRKKLALRMSNLESRSGYNPRAEEDIKFPSSTASSVVHSLGDCPPTGHPEINLTLSLASNFI